jgi:hypothetical protein
VKEWDRNDNFGEAFKLVRVWTIENFEMTMNTLENWRNKFKRAVYRLLWRPEKKASAVDCYVISFPKSGRTWLRTMLGRVYQEKFGGAEVELFEDIGKLRMGFRLDFVHEDEPFWKKADELVTIKDEYRDSKVLFLYRDPRDTLVSSFFEKSKRTHMYMTEYAKRPQLREFGDRVRVFEGTLSEYVDHDIGGFDTIIRYMNIWNNNKGVPREFLAISYEQLWEMPEQTLKQVLQFLGVPTDEGTIKNAVAFAAFDNMKSIESRAAGTSMRLKPGNLDDGESYKVRKGKVRGFCDYLTGDEIERLTKRMNMELSKEYNYR